MIRPVLKVPSTENEIVNITLKKGSGYMSRIIFSFSKKVFLSLEDRNQAIGSQSTDFLWRSPSRISMPYFNAPCQ